MLSTWNINNSKANSSRSAEIETNYTVEEKKLVIEMENIHLAIRYPQISIHPTNSSQGDVLIVINKQENINELLTPPEIQRFYEMISDGLIKISKSGEFVYDSLPHAYELGMNCTYTIGFMNNNFINLYKRSTSYTRNSDWNYEALLIDMQSGERIMPGDFFDAEEFYKYILEGAFKPNIENFDIQSFFENHNQEQLERCLKDAFINQDQKVEIVLSYGEGEETIIYADLNEVSKMIKSEYLEYLN